MSEPQIAVLVSGSGTNLQALIDAEDLRAGIAVVLSSEPKARALARAESAGIPTVVLDHRRFAARNDYDQALLLELRARRVTWVVLAGFMRIVGPELLTAFPGRILNIHPSLLPSFPGLHAQRQALRAGARIAGCTVHLVDAGTDTGPILAQAAVPVLPGDDEAALSARILRREHQLLPAVLRSLLDGRLRIDGTGRAELQQGLRLGVEAPSGDGSWLVSPPPTEPLR